MPRAGLPSSLKPTHTRNGLRRALGHVVEILAMPAAVLKRSNDRLWDDAFIDLCDDWAIPYIADLVSSRLVSALNPRGRRVDVAKTIYYRRRKGTLRVLEELISDISGWEGKAVEEFRRLARFAHSLDPKPARVPLDSTQGRLTAASPTSANRAAPFWQTRRSTNIFTMATFAATWVEMQEGK